MADASTTSDETSTSGRRLENGRVLYGTTKEHCDSMIEHSLKHSKFTVSNVSDQAVQNSLQDEVCQSAGSTFSRITRFPFN